MTSSSMMLGTTRPAVSQLTGKRTNLGFRQSRHTDANLACARRNKWPQLTPQDRALLWGQNGEHLCQLWSDSVGTWHSGQTSQCLTFEAVTSALALLLLSGLLRHCHAGTLHHDVNHRATD